MSNNANIYYDENLLDDDVSLYSLESTNSQRNNHYRAEVEKRLEAKRKAEIENLTFKPKLFPYKGTTEKSQTPTGQSRFDKLYEQAIARAHKNVAPETSSFQPTLVARSSSRGRRSPSPGLTKEAVQRLYESKGAGNIEPPAPAQFPFKPKITKRASSVERKAVDIAERLIQKGADVERRLSVERNQKQDTELSDCTFSPKLSMHSEVLSSIKQRTSNLPSNVSDRLLKYNEDRGKKLENMRLTKAALEASQLTFHPNISSSRVGSRSSTPTREPSVASSFAERLSEPKPIYSAANEFSFKPTINPVSSAISMTKGKSDEPVHVRLLKNAEVKKKEWSSLVQQIHEEEKTRTVPKVNSRAPSPAKPESMLPVHDRLSKPTQKQQLTILMTQLKSELEMNECTFQPSIPKYANGSSHHDDHTPIYERLNAEAQQMKLIAEKRQKLKELEEMKLNTFQPSVQAYGSDKVRNRDTTPIHERLNAEADYLKKQQVKRVEEKIKAEQVDLTFSPAIKPLKGSENRRNGDVITRFKQEAAKVLQRKAAIQSAAQKEIEKELTFTPTLTAKSSRTSKSYLWWNGDESASSAPNTTGKLTRTHSAFSNAEISAFSPAPTSVTKGQRRSSSASRLPSETARNSTPNNNSSNNVSSNRPQSASRGRQPSRDGSHTSQPTTSSSTAAATAPSRRAPSPSIGKTPATSTSSSSSASNQPAQLKRSASASRIPVRSPGPTPTTGAGNTRVQHAANAKSKSSSNNALVANRSSGRPTSAVSTASASAMATPAAEIYSPNGRAPLDTPWDSSSSSAADNVQSAIEQEGVALEAPNDCDVNGVESSAPDNEVEGGEVVETASTPQKVVPKDDSSHAAAASQSGGRSAHKASSPATPHYMLPTVNSEQHTHREINPMDIAIHSDHDYRPVLASHSNDSSRGVAGSSSRSSNSSVASSVTSPPPHYLAQTAASNSYFHSFEHKTEEVDGAHGSPNSRRTRSRTNSDAHHDATTEGNASKNAEDSNNEHDTNSRSTKNSIVDNNRETNNNPSNNNGSNSNQQLMEAAIRSLQHDFVESMQLSEAELLGGENDSSF